MFCKDLQIFVIELNKYDYFQATRILRQLQVGENLNKLTEQEKG